ncbi:hypothetical protein KUTeg_001805 [Tegillarca granosa]|uniref:Arf-GAP with coiled-coil, ANK repeat and PH domain-containing protein 2 n=1 Tax=Tegillarca granosa TaxID=220873 RepID=A0ABQ9FWW8_TEGGR|nr:hypothetical protein KUTeg_001805 [Tegillarca granosa]
MKPTIDFKECLKDSPKFRASLESAESDVELLEARLERLVKLCNVMIESGKSFKKASSDFITGVRDLASYFKDDDLLSDDSKNCLVKFAHEMSEMLKYFATLMDQANRSVCKNLSSFIKQDIKKVKDSRKDFEKISDDLDNALLRHVNSPRSKVQECEEALNVLNAKRSGFAHASLDYVFQMLSFMHAQNTFFHQGHDLFKEFEPEMKSVATRVEELSAKSRQERKEMEERHTLVQKKDLSQNNQSAGVEDDTNNVGPIEGYLFKRTSKGFKSWVRKRSGNKEGLSVMEDDLRLCTVKPAYEIDRRFCFEVLSPARSHMLQAESDDDCQLWIGAIQAGVTQAFRDSENVQSQLSIDEDDDSSPSVTSPDSMALTSTPSQNKPSKAQIRMAQLLSIPGNDHCCDCGSGDPRWASINLGITLCIECSGIHRSFGVHMSKVRSITLDAWEPELLKVMKELGNDQINRIYEANVDESIATKATPDCRRAKYVQKAFVSKLPSPRLSTGNKLKGWTVKKKSRRSPGRTASKDDSQSDNESDVTSGLMEASPSSSSRSKKAVLSVSNNSGKDNDSGLGASASDVIVFGTEIEFSDLSTSLDLESSEDSELEDNEDNKSTTSWEDMSKLDPNMLLYKATQARNLPVMLEALANGADPNWVNEDEEGKTPIMKAVETGSLSASEFMLLNGAKLDRKDKKGRTPLHHATIQGNTGQVCQFLKRGANLHTKDDEGLVLIILCLTDSIRLRFCQVFVKDFFHLQVLKYFSGCMSEFLIENVLKIEKIHEVMIHFKMCLEILQIWHQTIQKNLNGTQCNHDPVKTHYFNHLCIHITDLSLLVLDKLPGLNKNMILKYTGLKKSNWSMINLDFFYLFMFVTFVYFKNEQTSQCEKALS